MNIAAAVRSLKAHRATLQAKVRQLDSAIRVVGLLNGIARANAPRRRLSASARKRIADAQRARWAKWHASKKGKRS